MKGTEGRDGPVGFKGDRVCIIREILPRDDKLMNWAVPIMISRTDPHNTFSIIDFHDNERYTPPTRFVLRLNY